MTSSLPISLQQLPSLLYTCLFQSIYQWEAFVFFPLSSLLSSDDHQGACANSSHIYFCLSQEMFSPIKCVNSHVYYENLTSKF